jgi:hypothetical protein
MSARDPRNTLYYEKPPIETQFIKLLFYYRCIPLENAEEEWQRIQKELHAASSLTI